MGDSDDEISADELKRRQMLAKQRKEIPKEKVEKVETEEQRRRRLLKSIPKGEMDFAQAAKLFGYTRARQMAKQISIKHHQLTINKVDETAHVNKQPQRLQEAIRVSKTLGAPSMDTSAMKIMEATYEKRRFPPEPPAPLVSESGLVENKLLNMFEDPPLTPKETIDSEYGEIDHSAYIALKRSMMDSEGIIMLAQFGLEYLPQALGETLFLQTSYFKNISLPRNNLTSVFSYRLPQLASIHFRYVTDLNLSGNKLTRLPSDIGNMKSLVKLNLSNNLITVFPMSVRQATTLQELNLAKNSLSDIAYELSSLTSLTSLNLSENLFTCVPSPLPKLFNLKVLNMTSNMMPHLAIQPPLLKASDLWHPKVNMRNGLTCYMNILTKEVVDKIESYDNKGIELETDLHEFQPADSFSYRRRKMWLSVCQMPEWEPEEDIETGWTYFRNNVSGVTQWELPECLDLIGNMEALEDLNLTENNIRSIPESLYNLANLRKLNLKKNKVHEFSDNISKLTSLEILNINENEFKLLPPPMCEGCLQLRELSCVSNLIVRLPDMLGVLPNIQKIDATSNRMASLPYSLGYSKSLTELYVHENPLSDVPLDEVLKGLDSLKWYLRQKLMIQNRGKPPEMEFHSIGLGEEVNIIKPVLNERIRGLVNVAMQTGFISFMLLNITDIPKELYLKVKKLKRMQLDFNTNLVLQKGFVPELGSLKHLTMKSCKLAQLPENIDNLKRLSHLNCEVNLFETLPDSITKLKSLMILDISKNRLHQLPKDFHNLVALKHLNLEANYLETIPMELYKIRGLLTINLARNRLLDIPASLCQISTLKKLNLEVNRIYALPLDLAHMSLIELRIGNNRIESLDEHLFAHTLGTTIKVFSCPGNNLLELPNSLYLIDKESFFEAEANPLISPPQLLLAEGLVMVQNYLKIRQKRLNELEELLDDEDFEFVRSNAVPMAFEVLQDGTGFLTPEDLAEFDQAIDEYANGEFYKCPASGADIVESIVKLREFRETDIYLTVLEQGLLKVIEKINATSSKGSKAPRGDNAKYSRRLFGDSVLMSQQRSWGRNGEMANVWCISLPAILKDLPEGNVIHRNGRISIFNLVKEILPPMAFPFTVDLLKDSLRLYVSPYGQVANTEQVTFKSCDCVDEERNRASRHNPCIKPAVVIVKSIYYDEEATRRDIEEDEYLMRFEEMEENVRIWLETDQGKKETDKEISRRKARIVEEISLRDEMALAEEMKIRQARAKLAALEKRKGEFEGGASFEITGFTDIGDAVKAIAAEEKVLVKHTNREEALRLKARILREELSQDIKVRKAKARDDLVQKYCAKKYDETISACRIYAHQRGLRRHWDGEDGDKYKDWMRRHVRHEGEELLSLNELMIKAEMEEKMNQLQAAKPTDKDKDKIEDDPPEYNWDGTEDMEKFSFPLYTRYMNIKRARLDVQLSEFVSSATSAVQNIASDI